MGLGRRPVRRRAWRTRAARFTDVHEPVYYGPDVAAALDWARSFACTRHTLDRLDHADAASTLRRLQEMLAAHLGKDGVWLGSRAWIVTARRR